MTSRAKGAGAGMGDRFRGWRAIGAALAWGLAHGVVLSMAIEFVRWMVGR